MNQEPHFEGDLEMIYVDADIHGHSVRIEVGREAIEDRVGEPSMSPDERLDFVKRNRRQIVENVTAYTRTAPDVTGIRIALDQLAHCD